MIEPADRAVVSPAAPRQVDGVLTCDVRDELLLYVPETRAAVTLNATARLVWESCRGDASVEAIADGLGQRFGVPAEVLMPDVLEVVARLRGFGLLV